MTLKVSIIAVDELLKLVDGHRLLQMKLRWTDYHRVHCPVDGIVRRIDVFRKDQLFPGAEAMTIMFIEAAFGIIKLICIGEWSIQSFVLKVGVNQRVQKLDEIGYFDLGSQVILVLPTCIDVLPAGGEKVFPGDPVAVVASSSKNRLAFRKTVSVYTSQPIPPSSSRACSF
ncbi:unnamed protein product [Polarella glacialis]|uniref:Phosphatidylserine decarboxylase n=1 Tax=Polarella glacialis TaxID=89957 RepID=A0A813GAZ6_POLGL|nr:unnamed protein product [Polarella glacialis]